MLRVRPGCRSRRPGFSSLELIIAFGLSSAVLAFATPLVVAHGKLMLKQRDYRIALSELANQFEQLSLVPPEQVAQRVKDLQPSEFATQQLPEAKLTGQLEAGELGQRVTLQLVWDEPNRHQVPVQLTAWLPAAAANPPAAAEEANR